MKKIILLLVVTFITLNGYSQERELNVGLNGGITTSDIKNYSSVAFGIDANYLFDRYEDFKFGPSVNLIYFSPKEQEGISIKPFTYISIGGSIVFKAIAEKFYIGTDLGYAMGISPSGDRGGIFFKPKVGYEINDSFKVNLFYATVKKKQPAYSYIGLGLEFNIFGGKDYYAY